MSGWPVSDSYAFDTEYSTYEHGPGVLIEKSSNREIDIQYGYTYQGNENGASSKQCNARSPFHYCN
jgi:hypothetical protein